MKFTVPLQLALFFGVASARPQGFLSEVASIFGFGDDGDDETTTSKSGKTLAPPASTSASSVKTTASSKSSSASSTGKSTATATSKSRSTQTSNSDTTTATSSNTSTITSAPTLTSTSTSSSSSTPPPPPPPPPTPTSAQAIQPTDTSTPDKTNNGVPPGGIAVAVILIIAVLAGAAYLIFRYNPRVRQWWLAKQDKKRQERSYRDAIDGPFALGGSGVRNTTGSNSRKSMLQSFFAPRTVKLGNGQEIRRKPVNWGAGVATPHIPPVPQQTYNNTTPTTTAYSYSRAHPVTAELPGDMVALEKVGLTHMAAPMARSESTKSVISELSGAHSPGGSSNGGVSSISPSPAVLQKELPSMPPVPEEPAGGRRDMHRILSRKSIFELA